MNMESIINGNVSARTSGMGEVYSSLAATVVWATVGLLAAMTLCPPSLRNSTEISANGLATVQPVADLNTFSINGIR